MTEPIRRQFALTLARAGADRRTVGGCCVPYNKPSVVSDNGVHVYREMFAPGAFGRQLSAAHRITLKYAHGQGLLDTVGRATQFDERDDGLFGEFRVFDGLVGDQALTLVDEGVLVGLSVAGVPTRSTRNADGVVVREKMRLTEISLCESPAYADALVGTRRTRLEVRRRSDDALLDRLEAVHIRVSR